MKNPSSLNLRWSPGARANSAVLPSGVPMCQSGGGLSAADNQPVGWKHRERRIAGSKAHVSGRWGRVVWEGVGFMVLGGLWFTEISIATSRD